MSSRVSYGRSYNQIWRGSWSFLWELPKNWIKFNHEFLQTLLIWCAIKYYIFSRDISIIYQHIKRVLLGKFQKIGSCSETFWRNSAKCPSGYGRGTIRHSENKYIATGALEIENDFDTEWVRNYNIIQFRLTSVCLFVYRIGCFYFFLFLHYFLFKWISYLSHYFIGLFNLVLSIFSEHFLHNRVYCRTTATFLTLA